MNELNEQASCRVCGHQGHAAWFVARERMFGFGDRFDYFQCSQCECLQISNPDIDTSKFYPSTYYSFGSSRASGFKRAIKTLRDRQLLVDRGLLTSWIMRVKPNISIRSLAHMGLQRDARIADIGCGSGLLLNSLSDLGFRNLFGIDPHVAAESVGVRGPQIHKRRLEDMPPESRFDLIMFHHSLEHIPDQGSVLQAAAARLAPEGTCLIRIPIASSWAWRHYGVDWIQLDAPRHLYLHSRRSLEIVSAAAKLRVVDVGYDSTDFQMWGSEALRQGFRLFDPATGAADPRASALRRSNQTAFRRHASTLNKQCDGDQAVFTLRHA